MNEDLGLSLVFLLLVWCAVYYAWVRYKEMDK